MDGCSSLRIAAELKNLSAMRHFVREAGAAFGLDPDVISDTVLAVDEAATNIILHGYQGQEGEIELDVCRRGDDLIVHLRDDASTFDPVGVPSPDLSIPLEMRRPGGLGVHLIRQLVDKMEHRDRPRGGNELILIKRGVNWSAGS